MSAQVQIKLLPFNYEVIITQLQRRYNELADRITGNEGGPDEIEEWRIEAGSIANALADLDAKIPS